MYYDFTVEIPQETRKIYIKKNKSGTYVNYRYESVYVKEKKYAISKTTTIGKVCEENPSLMYPNPNFIKYFPEVSLPNEDESSRRSSCLHIGTHLVLEKLVREAKLDEILKTIYDDRGCGLFLDFVSYLIITEGNAAQYYPDYAYNHPLFTPKQKIYSDSTISRFLNEISMDRVVQFLNEWNKEKPRDQRIYISYDSTNKLCDAGDVNFVEVGHSKEDAQLPIVNIAVAYDAMNREPLFYEEYPGSVNDVSQFQLMLEKAAAYGYKKAAFILDRGYFSKANIRLMDANGYEFVIMVKGLKPLVNGFVKEVKNSFEEKRSCYVNRYHSYGTTLRRKVFASDERDRYIHIFYDAEKAANEKKALENKLDSMAKNLAKLIGKKKSCIERSYSVYFEPEYAKEKVKDEKGNEREELIFTCAREKEDVIDAEMSVCGYFCIITSEEMTAKEALELYKSRDASEKLFAVDKTFLGSSRERVQTDESFSGKLLIEFAALILRNCMYAKLKDAEEEMSSSPNYMTVPAAIRQLEKIEMIEIVPGVYKLSHAVTKMQRDILRAFDMNTASVKNKAEEISEKLNPKNITVEIGKH